MGLALLSSEWHLFGGSLVCSDFSFSVVSEICFGALSRQLVIVIILCSLCVILMCLLSVYVS